MKQNFWNHYKEENIYFIEDKNFDEDFVAIGDIGINLSESQLAQNIFFTPVNHHIMEGEQQVQFLKYFQTDGKKEVNLVFHLLKLLDDANATNHMTFDKRFFRQEILSGRYGKQAKQSFESLKEREQDIFLYYLAWKDANGNRFSLLIQILKDLFEEVTACYDDFEQMTYIFTTSPETEYNQNVLELAKFFFEEFFSRFEIVWNTKPIFLGETALSSTISENYNLF